MNMNVITGGKFKQALNKNGVLNFLSKQIFFWKFRVLKLWYVNLKTRFLLKHLQFIQM